MAYKLTPEQYKDVAQRRITNKNTAENTNSAVSAYARALNASRALDNKNKQNVEAQSVAPKSANTGVQASDDWFIRTLSTVAAPVLRFSEGVAKFFENAVLDAGAGLTASVLDIFGADEAAKDVQAWAAHDAIGEAFDWEGIEQIYQNSWSNEWGSFGELLQEGIYTVGQQAIPFALNFIPGAGTALSMGAFALGGYGGGFESASQDGGSVLGASAYGLVSSALETAIEGIGGAFKFGKGATVVDDVFDGIIEKVAKREGVQRALGYVVDAVGEGAEEVLSGMLQNYIRAMTYKADTSSVEAYFNNIFTADPATQEELWEQFILGAVSGAMMGGASRVVARVSPTMQISENIQETEALREKGYNLNRRGKDTSKVESQLVAGEQGLMEQVNAKFEQLTAKRKDGNAADKVLSYMESNFKADENGKFISSKNGLVKAENVSYGVTEKDIEESVVGQGNAVHVGVIEGAAAETKSVVEKSIDNYNKVLGRKNHASRLKLVFADIAQNQDEVRSYGYLSGNVVVIDVNALNENVEFQVFQEGKTKTYSTNAAMSTLLHEVFHFTESTKAGEKLRKVLIDHATNDSDIIHAMISGTKIEQGDNAAAEKSKQLAGADILTQTEKAYQDASESVLGSELSARQLENLLFNEKVIERLTEDNSTIAKRILNNAKRLVDALKGVKMAETKELGILLGTTVKLYNKAIAQVGSGKYLTTDKQTQYSKRGYQPRDYFEVTKEEYEHHAWATINGVLSGNESGLFMKKIGEKKLGTRFSQAADGSYMVSVGENGVENKIVFTDGNWDAPSIDRVFYIKADDETSIDIVRGFIYESKGIIDADYFDELLEIYNAEAFQYSTQRNGSGKDSTISERNGDRRGTVGEVKRSLRLTDKNKENGNVERSDEFRRIQAESLGLSDEDIRMFHRGGRILDEGIRGRLSRVFRRELISQRSRGGYAQKTLVNKKSNREFLVYGNVDADTFYDIFQIVHNYLRCGDAVDIHDKEYYKNCRNYLTEDGLGGFSITEDGDLISVFNLGQTGLLQSIRDYVCEQGAVSLDCYNSDIQELAEIYQSKLGFKTASILDFNYDVLAEDRGQDYADYFVKTYGEEPVHFMVLTDANVEVKHFEKDDYIAAVKHQRKYINADSKIKYSRRVVSNEGASRSIDDALEMLSVLGNINEDTHRLEIGKKQLLDNYIARINDQATKGRLSERSKVVKELVDAIFDTAIMAEYHDADYLSERVAVVNVLRKYFHSMNLSPIKSEIQGEYGKTNNIFKLWGNKESGRSWDTVVQEIVEEMPQLADDGDASGISTLYNVFNSYEKAVKELKAEKVKVNSFIQEADEVKRMMAKQLVLSLKENSTELITKIEANALQNKLVDLQNAVEDTFRAVRRGAATVTFQGENIPTQAEIQLRKIVEDIAKEHAIVYADRRASDFIARIKKDLTDSELREIKKTDVYKAMQADIVDRYLKEHKEISFKSIEGNSARLIELKHVIGSAKNVRRLTDMNREALKQVRDLNTKLLKDRVAEIALDDTHVALIDNLQGKVKALFEETVDGKNTLMPKNKMLSSGALLEVVTAFEAYIGNEALMEDFKARGEFESIQKKVAEYKAYISSLSGASYNEMPLSEKLTFDRAMASFVAEIVRVTKPTTTITADGKSVSATKYRDLSLRKIYTSLHKDKNGNYRGNKRAFAAFWAKYFQNSVRPFEAIALAENHAGGLLALYNEVRNGYIKGENARADLEDIFLNFVNDKANKVGKKSYADYLMQEEVEIQHSEGTFVVTKGELLGLYLTLIQDDGFLHADASNPLAEGIYFDNKNMLTNYRNAKALKFTAENVAALEQHLSETDIQFVEVVREFFKKAGELKGSVDLHLYGIERLLGEDYYPLQTDESARESTLGNKVSFYDALDPSGHLSINQSRTAGVKALRVRNIADLMTSYAKSVGLYYGVAVPVADMRMVYSSKGVYGESIKDCISKYSTDKFNEYLNRLLLDVQGAIKIEDSFLERQRQRYATYAIAANIKSPIKALGGILSLEGRLKATLLVKGIISSPFSLIKSGRADFSQMYEYCPATRMRYRDHQATMAAMNMDSVSRTKNKIVDKLAIGIELVDKYTIYVAWNTAKAEVGAVGKNANDPVLLKKAGKLLDEAMDTTDRFEMTERNAYSRSPDALHRGFSMFTSASQAQLTQTVDKLSTQAQLYHLKKRLPEYVREAESNRDMYSKQLEKAQETLSKVQSSGDATSIRDAEREVRKIKAMLRDTTLQVGELYDRQNTIDNEIKDASKRTVKMLISISASIIASAALSRLMDNLMGDKDEEEVGEEFLAGMLDESIANVFSMFPIFGQLYNAIDGFGNFEKKSYDMSFWLIDEWNGLADAFNTLAAYMDGTGNKPPLKVAYEVLNAIGMWTGIPIRNLYNTVSTFLKVDASTSYEFQNAFSKGTYGSDLKKAIDAGDKELAETITRLMMKDTFGDTDTKVVATVRSLYEQGYSNVIPKTVSKSVTIDGVSYEMTSKQQQAFKKIYSQADTAIERLVGKQSFVKLSPKVQADAIKWIYDYYYDRAKENLSGVEDDSRKALFGSYINIDTLAVAYSYCRSLEADTDKNGKAINGTRKAKVVKYLSSLKTSAAEKYMILGYLGYSPVNTGAKTLITSFARKNGASKAEIAELLEGCNIAA